MRHLLAILAALFICSASLHAQTLKSLMYNSTNGQVVANTGTNVLTFMGNVGFGGGDITITGQGISGYGASVNLEEQILSANGYWTLAGSGIYDSGEITFANSTNSSATRTNLGLGWSALTNTNSATSLLGFTTNGQVVANTGTNVLTFTNAVNLNYGISENGVLIWDSQNNEFYASATFHGEIDFGGSNAPAFAATTRTNLGLPLAALTNTSNVTMIQSLSGAAAPAYSGTIMFTNVAGIVVSNGIIVDIEE